MSNFLNKIPVSPITSFGNPSVPNGSTIGTNFSILQTGGFMEVYTLSGLTYTIPPATTGIIEFSGNSIPIQFTKGSGSVFSPDVLTLNSDNISSGRRKLGMLAYVYETNKIYQFRIDNYDTLWNNATGATGPGGPTVVISNFGTTVKNNSAAGIALINAWTASTISGIGGYEDTNASWRVLSTGGGTSVTGGTFNNNTDTLTLNNSTGGTITITGFTDYYTTGFTFNPASYDLTIKRNDGLPDLSVNLSILSSDVTITGGTYNSSTGTATFTNNTGGTFNVTGFLTGFTDIYVTGGTFNNNNQTLTLTRTDNVNVNVSGFTDVFVTGGTYSSSTGVSTFRNNTGGTFNVSGYFKPSDDIYVSGGTVDQGPSSESDNRITLNRNNASSIDITNLVNIVDITRSDIVALSKYIRGKTYKISGCDTSLYYNGIDGKGNSIYTSIYLMGLENNKLSETGIGVFYTPKYSDFSIFVDGTLYGLGDKVIWGGYVWECTGSVQSSIDLFTLDPAGFDISYPFDENPNLSDKYNIQYDDIIYDLTNDKITYRNEQNSNIVSTTTENIQYWEDLFGYNPIKVFQWGNVYTSGPGGIGNQRIINSYNENINYTGQYQKDFYFNNLSYQKNVYSTNVSYQELFNFDNQSYQENIEFRETSYQKSLYFINLSRQADVILQNGYQINIILENQSYQETITVRDGYQINIILENQSYQENLVVRDFYQTNLIFNQGSQYGEITDNQSNITIKNYNRDLSTQAGAEDGLFFINDLPNVKTEKFIGKIGNQLVEVDGLTYDGSQFVFTDNVYSTSNLTFNQISASTYLGLPLDIRVTGGTYSGSTIIFTNNTGGTFNVTGITSGGGGIFTGGTVTGATIFTGGLTANTISATTYQNLPQDIFVTGGTYTSGNAIFTNNSGGTFTVSGFPIGSGGGQIFYLNLSQSQNGNRLLSTTASTASEQSTGVTINNGVTGTIASFQSQPLNTTLLPGGVWSFYLHSYKQNNNASFDIFVEVYKRTSGGTQTLLFTTDPAPVTTNSPNPSMQLSDGYFSGTPLSVSDGVVAVVRATNTDNQPHIITFVTEGNTHYSYVVSTIPTQQGLTCDTLSGCSIIQTIQTDVSNKLDKSGGTITGNLIINSGLTATTISATTYQNLPTDVRVTGSTYSNNTFTYTNNTGGTFNVLFNTVTGLTVNGNLTVTGTTTSTTISATTYQNLPTDIRVTGGTYSNGTATFTNNTGGTFNVTGLYTGGTDVFVTGATKSNTVATFTNNTGGTFTLTGLTDTFVTGGTYSGSTIIFTNNTGGTFSVTGITTSSAFTGGTVTGATSFTGGLTANTITPTSIIYNDLDYLLLSSFRSTYNY